MKIFERVRDGNRRRIYFCGMKIVSYNKRVNVRKKLAELERDIELFKRAFGVDWATYSYIFQNGGAYLPNYNLPKTYWEKWHAVVNRFYDRHDSAIRFFLNNKISAKEYFNYVLGTEHTVKTLGLYKAYEDIDFKVLPKSFVLKSTFGCYGREVILIKDKSKIEKKTLEQIKSLFQRTSTSSNKSVKSSVLA